LSYDYFKRSGKSSDELVLSICAEMQNSLPKHVAATFQKGKHLNFEEAFSKLNEKRGKFQFILMK
jgi:hypothetical protein